MITHDQISTVLDHPVYDADGDKIGAAQHVYLDDSTGEPEWVSVKTGLFGSNESFVPIGDASMVDDHMQVPYDKDTIKGAPNVDVDAGGHLSVEEERHLYDHYGIDWDTSGQQAHQTPPAESRRNSNTAQPDADTGNGGGNAMTRSEERMHAGTERYESGRARLRKYVVTEEVQRTIPVRHEEVRVEREPISDGNRDAAMSGVDIAEAEHEVTLHAERPVVEIVAEPVERVRLSTDEYTDEETVAGTVRKERIEADEPKARGDQER